jgi:hypothetical protein
MERSITRATLVVIERENCVLGRLFPCICNERVSIYTSTRKHNFSLLGGSIRFQVEFGDEVTITALKPFKFTYLGKMCSVRRYKSIKLQYEQSISLDNHISMMEVRVLPPLPKYTPNDSPWEWKNLNRYLLRLPENLRYPVAFKAVQWKRNHLRANLQTSRFVLQSIIFSLSRFAINGITYNVHVLQFLESLYWASPSPASSLHVSPTGAQRHRPLMWWKQHQQKLPDLSRMTRQYLDFGVH